MQFLGWRDLSPPGQRLASQLGITEANFPAAIDSIGARHSARLRQGEIDHLIFYMLQSKEFTAEDPIDPAASAAAEAVTPSVRRRIADFSRALANPPAGGRSISPHSRRRMQTPFSKSNLPASCAGFARRKSVAVQRHRHRRVSLTCA